MGNHITLENGLRRIIFKWSFNFFSVNSLYGILNSSNASLFLRVSFGACVPPKVGFFLGSSDLLTGSIMEEGFNLGSAKKGLVFC